MHDELLVGIDFGTSALRIVVAQQQRGDRKDLATISYESEAVQLHILGCTESPTEGIQKGVITSIDDVVATLAAALERTERQVGLPINHAFVSFNNPSIIAQASHGVIAVARMQGEIDVNDVDRVIGAAQAVATPANYEMIHVLPRSFIVDAQVGIKDPIGMTGVRLEVDAQIIEGQSSHLKNVQKVMYRAGLEIDDIVLGSLASAQSALTRQQKELGVALVDIGFSTTSMIVFEEGDVLTAKVLPIGAAHMTSDVAIGLRVALDVAEEIKRTYGTVLVDKCSRKEEIALSKFDANETESFSRRHLAEILSARLEEIFEMVDKELVRIGRSGMLPAGIVLTGGGAKLSGVVECAKNTFRLPARLASPPRVVSALEAVNDPSFVCALGLVLWGGREGIEGGGGGSVVQKSRSMIGSMSSWVKGLWS